MKENNPDLRNISGEIQTKGYYERARQRAQRRRSPWNLLLIPLVIGSTGLTTYSLFRAMWQVHTMIYPDHAGRLGEFWGKGIGFRTFVSSFLLAMPLLFAALPLGMIVANGLAWCIGPARRAFNREAEGVKWASFRQSVSGLAIVAAVVVPLCLLLSFIGAVTLQNLE